MIDQYAFTAPFEGVVPHLYLDSLGFATCGVGFLVDSERALLELPWSPSTQAARADWALVKAAPRGHVASFYKQYCKAWLKEPAMRAVFQAKVDGMRRAMQPVWRLTLLPEPAQLALVDMAYNLGVSGLSKFHKLQAAVLVRDWHTAAAECMRNGVQPARNAATAQLFTSLI